MTQINSEAPAVVPLNHLIIERGDLNDSITVLAAEIKDLKAQRDAVDFKMMIQLDGQGVKRMANESYSVSIAEETVPEVTDWDQLYAHITATQDFSLVQRRVSAAPYREILNAGNAVPGIQPRQLRKINFRKI